MKSRARAFIFFARFSLPIPFPSSAFLARFYPSHPEPLMRVSAKSADIYISGRGFAREMCLSCVFTFVNYVIAGHALSRARDATTKISPGVISRRDARRGSMWVIPDAFNRRGDAKLRSPSRSIRDYFASALPKNDVTRLCFRYVSLAISVFGARQVTR